MKNAEQMTEELQKVFDGLLAGEIKHKDAAELINATGKMVGLAKVQLEYFAYRQEKPVIKFLAQTDTK